MSMIFISNMPKYGSIDWCERNKKVFLWNLEVLFNYIQIKAKWSVKIRKSKVQCKSVSVDVRGYFLSNQIGLSRYFASDTCLAFSPSWIDKILAVECVKFNDVITVVGFFLARNFTVISPLKMTKRIQIAERLNYGFVLKRERVVKFTLFARMILFRKKNSSNFAYKLKAKVHETIDEWWRMWHLKLINQLKTQNTLLISDECWWQISGKNEMSSTLAHVWDRKTTKINVTVVKSRWRKRKETKAKPCYSERNNSSKVASICIANSKRPIWNDELYKSMKR